MAAAGFLVAGSTRAEAMHNESEAAIAAGFLFGIPVIHAIAREAVLHEQAYGHAYPPRYIERTKVVYAEPRHKRMQRNRHRDHDRDCRHGWDRHDDRRGREDSRRDSHRHNDRD